MMAMSVSAASVRARPATTSSKVDSSPSSKVGCGIQVPSVVKATRTAPMGPSKGMPESINAADDVDLVAESVGERRPQRTVDQAAGQDRLVRALAFTTEERAGDFAGGVGPLLNVDGEGEEVRSLPHVPGRGGRGQQHGVADAGDHGPVGQLGEFPRLE